MTCTYDPTSAIHSPPHYHRSQQYSITALTDSNATIKERYAYTAYGTPTITDASGTVRTATAEGNRYTYTGRGWDEDVEIYHYRARMYDPLTGRFLSRDPIGYVDGTSIYEAYFALRGLDPFGTETLGECFANCEKQWPPPVQGGCESDEDFKKRQNAQRESRRNCGVHCMKKVPPAECDPFKNPKQGPKRDRQGKTVCWIDRKGREWCVDIGGGDEDTHYDVEPPIAPFENDCWTCVTKTKDGNKYTRCFPKWFKKW